MPSILDPNLRRRKQADMLIPQLADVLRDAGVPDLIEILAERLTPLELESVLSEVHRERAGRQTPGDLLLQYQQDSRVRPAVHPASLAEIDKVVLITATRFEPLELSPICPTGTLAVLASLDVGSAWSVGGAGEVVSNCPAVLALECARRRQASPAAEWVRLWAGHRELYAPLSAPLRSAPHSRVIGLSTAGADEGDFRFETGTLLEHLEVHLRVLERLGQEGYRIGLVRVVLFAQSGTGFDRTIETLVAAPLAAEFPTVGITLEPDRARGRGRYGPIGFAIAVEDSAEVEQRVALGGFTDWTRRLLNRNEERLLVSTLAAERVRDVVRGRESEPARPR